MHGQTPSLAPELWNLSTVIVLCGLMGWMMRLVRMLLIYLEVRFAIQQHAVIHLENLGPSLHVLRHASMWHFHQLLRTQLQVASTTMTRVRVPFEFVGPTVKLLKSEDEQQPRMSLSVEVKSEAKCVVQVFWNVNARALDGTCQGATNAQVNWPVTHGLKLVDAVLPTRAARSAIHAVRSLPRKVFDMDFTSTPHRLLDEEVGKENGYNGGSTPKAGRHGLCLAHFFARGDSFRGSSVMERSKSSGVNEFMAPIPSDLLGGVHAEEAIQSSVLATDCENESQPAPNAWRADDSHYSCVVAVGSPAFFESAAEPTFPGFRMKRRASSSPEHTAEEEDVLCQCMAINFLPTPAKPHLVPVVVKKLHFTASNVFSSQEIFGRDSSTASECVICLERAPAAVLLPCRHFCVCRECLEEIDQCPICRAKFSTYACFQDSRNSSNHTLALHVT